MSECENTTIREVGLVVLTGRHRDGPGSDSDPCPFCAESKPYDWFDLSEIVMGEDDEQELETIAELLTKEPTEEDMQRIDTALAEKAKAEGNVDECEEKINAVVLKLQANEEKEHA